MSMPVKLTLVPERGNWVVNNPALCAIIAS
jgi:hypothetical protein